MRFKEKLDEAKLSPDNVDKILLKSASKTVFEKIRRSIDNYISQVDMPENADKTWTKEKKQMAYRTILQFLSTMEKELK